MRRVVLSMAAAGVALGGALAQDLRGHGGPVGALAVDGSRVLSGSFDTRAILWNGDAGLASRVLRHHTGNVTAVALLPDGQVVTGGQEGEVVAWPATGEQPSRLLARLAAPVGALAVSPDGVMLAAAAWDGSLSLLRRDGSASERIDAHGGRITGAAFLGDGRLATVAHDLRLRFWAGSRLAATIDLPAPPAALAALGEALAVAFADGAVRLYAEGTLRAEVQPSARPLLALAAHDGLLAASGLDGTVWLLDATTLAPRRTIGTGQGPVWSVAIGDGFVLTGGADGTIRRWDAATGTAQGQGGGSLAAAVADGSRGAEVWQACALCHTLGPDDGNRAGPSLHGLFGRRIATAPGYAFSPALQAMDIVWTPETVSALFEHGPEAYTPGSRMPDQRLPDPADRAALVAFLERHAQ